MSYCRFSEGDVYMYHSSAGIVCALCSLSGGASHDPTFNNPQDALAHLHLHQDAGGSVPARAFTALHDEIARAQPLT